MSKQKKLFLHPTEPGVLVDENGKVVTNAEVIGMSESHGTKIVLRDQTGHVEAMESRRVAAPPASKLPYRQSGFQSKIALIESFISLGMSRKKAMIAADAEYLLTEMDRAGINHGECDRLIKDLLTPIEPTLHEEGSTLVRHLLKETK
jgi:hypothetical protein